MRKWLEGIALLALGLHVSMTLLAFFGDQRLPQHIPIRFDASGHPVAWGSPSILLLLPAITSIIYLLFTVVTRSPGAFNYPVTVTAMNRRRVQSLALDMMAWLKAEIVSLLTWMQWATIEVARYPERHMPVMTAVALVAVFATLTFYMAKMYRAGKDANLP